MWVKGQLETPTPFGTIVRAIWKFPIVIFGVYKLIIQNLRTMQKGLSNFCVHPIYTPTLPPLVHLNHIIFQSQFLIENYISLCWIQRAFYSYTQAKPLISSLLPCLPLRPLKSKHPSWESFECGWDYILYHKSKIFITKKPQCYYFWMVSGSEIVKNLPTNKDLSQVRLDLRVCKTL